MNNSFYDNKTLEQLIEEQSVKPFDVGKWCDDLADLGLGEMLEDIEASRHKCPHC